MILAINRDMDQPSCQSELAPLSWASSKAEPDALPFLLLADDLTGACDASVAFVQQGFSATVLLGDSSPSHCSSATLLAVVTQTRDLTPEQARARMLDLPQLRNFNFQKVFHKVDSAGRGNPGAEMAVLFERTGCDAVVYAPAFPAAGRVVVNGVLHVSDFAGQSRQVDLAGLIPEPYRTQIARIPVGDPEAVRAAMTAARSVERNLWICDAVAEQDLAAVAVGAEALNLRLLWVGSAGLAAQVARLQAGGAASRPAEQAFPHGQSRSLVLSGTDHPVTIAQMEQCARRAVRLTLDASPLPRFDAACLQIDWSRITPEALRDFWQRLHVADQPPVSLLVLTGGDTAAFVLEALGACSLRMGGELEPGIPWSRIQGGLAEGVLLVTKSGGFGTPDSLMQCLNFS